MSARLTRRRGVTSLLAMLYLILFGTLAIGFYAATNTQSQIVGNDERVARAFMACESGMDFMRYQLGTVNIPEDMPGEQVMERLFDQLSENLHGSPNLGGLEITRKGNTIYIPGDDGWINLDPAGNGAFRATITDWAGEIVVKIDGRYGNTGSAGRAITMDFTRKENTNTFDYFNFAIASRGQIRASKGVITSVTGVDPRIAALMSTQVDSNAIVVSGALIGGDLSVLSGGSVNYSSGSVGGSSIGSVIMADHVHVVPTPPDFPDVDTSVFEQYATNPYVPGVKTQSNIQISGNVSFEGGETVQGIMFIKSGSSVRFRGNFTLKGFIVMEGAGTLDFRGNVAMEAVPNQPEFDALRSVSGIAILAPDAAVIMSGNSSSLRGNMLVNTFKHNGAGNVHIDQGTLMTYSPDPDSAVFDSSKGIWFTSTGADNKPNTGIIVNKDHYYSPKPETYQEVTP